MRDESQPPSFSPARAGPARQPGLLSHTPHAPLPSSATSRLARSSSTRRFPLTRLFASRFAPARATTGVWDAQKAQPKNEMGKMSAPVIADQCGLASVQKFDGEDRSRATRTALQKAQMRSWTMQQTAEKSAREAEAVIEDARYAEYLKTVQEARDVLESEEADERRRQTTLMKDDNKALAYERMMKLQDAKQQRALADAKELAVMDADPMLSENTAMMTSALGEQRIRGDHFKGFSKAQIQQIYLDNEDVLREKAVRQAAELSDSANFVAQHEELRKLVEESEYQQKQFQRSMMAEHSAVLEQQKLEQRAMRASEKTESRGHIGPGLMDGFGCSWR